MARRAVIETTPCGRNVYCRIFTPRERTRKGEPRKAKENPTTEAMQRQNDRNAARRLAMTVDCNFGVGDLHCQATYAGDAPTPAEAKAHLARYIRALREIYRRRGAPFKYIVVTEYEAKRIHHHILLPKDSREGVTFDEIADAWPHGNVFRRKMYSRTLHALAGYLVKETARTSREEGAVFKRRWSGSRNLVRPPEPDRAEVDASMAENPRPPKGWEIDEDSVFEGVNPYTGAKFVDYVLVPEGAGSRYRKRRGAARGRPRATGERKWLEEQRSAQLVVVRVDDLFAAGEGEGE